ncbi:MAG: hypothetical protein CM15mP12_8300 [Gammaproteobacteria bacterium]|nr:MAG: hypothetical protein CM15mP12_8300 [Gammaproteobacteria bacterium]
MIMSSLMIHGKMVLKITKRTREIFKKENEMHSKHIMNGCPFARKVKRKIWRSFKIGNLINLMMLDTRSVARDKQLDIESYFEGKISKQNHIRETYKNLESFLK